MSSEAPKKMNLTFLGSKAGLAVAFVAGGLVMNATSAVSNAKSTQDMLSDALADALLTVKEREVAKEEQELAKLPNILDCQNMKWLENCSTINKQAKKNPNAPMRVTNAKGLEFNFQPGTPSAMIRLQLEQSPEAAAAAVKYMDQTWGEYKQSASLYQVAMWENQDLQNINGLEAAQDAQKALKNLDTKNLSVSIFIESTCPVCDRYLGAVEKLQKRYPTLSIRVFQLDNNQEAFIAKVGSRGLRGRILSPSEVAKVQQQGIRSWPVTWVDHLPTKKRETILGNRTLNQVETRLLAMTYAARATQIAKAEK